MSDEAGDPPDDRIANGGIAPDGADPAFTSRDFEEELSAVVRRAARNGVDVVGGWTVEEADGSTHALGIEIFPVRRE